MNPKKRQKLEEAGWKVSNVEELLNLTREEKLQVNQLVENTKFFEKWGTKKCKFTTAISNLSKESTGNS